MSGFFDDSHVMGLPGSAGPPVSLWDMTQQAVRQQFRVDSELALDEELRTRWADSLRALRDAGQGFNAPIAEPLMYRQFARFVREGTPVTMPTVEGTGYGARINEDLRQPHPEFEEMRRANEAIRQLNNPNVRTFEQILEEVGEMQQGVEEETASMRERAPTGSFFAELLGAAVGSFSTRDPLNIVTAPIGAGRTILARIATDMAVAAGVVTATELGDVQPNRALAGLPERDPLFNILAATFGAGVVRGAIIEPIAYGVGRLRSRPDPEGIDFDLRDRLLQQMFEQNDVSPTARAASSILDDTIFIERNNPYGEGRAASERFVAELASVQRAMNAEPMTAIARVLPPIPFEYIQKAADFEIVREQAPLVYARMEAAQQRVQALNASIEQRAALRSAGAPVGRTSDESFAETSELMARYDDEALPNESREDFVVRKTREETQPETGLDDIDADAERLFDLRAVERRTQNDPTLIPSGVERRQANIEYEKAYRAVEAEAARLHEVQARAEAAQQREASNILTVANEGRPFVGPLLRYDNVESLVERINAFNDTLNEVEVARFVRETVGEGDNKVEVEAWEKDGGIDIGLARPVDPDFRFVTDDGEMSVGEAMRDLQDDVDLVEAIKGCSL